ncbi:hypothetical protein FUAX_45940 (plasmid) [Fulvitalea axinellae]|uniref:Uncharacterized protein n=2 Tax=Fulvitalea axinellae TaxID=1182444 RepID=A0AAU9CW68_9BACT|nr:hypothetical protein FUAX_45940 [Fulvitalea axinellae]
MIGSAEFASKSPVIARPGASQLWSRITKEIEDLERFKEISKRLASATSTSPEQDTRISENIARHMSALRNIETLINQYFGHFPPRLSKYKEPEDDCLYQLQKDLQVEWLELVETWGDKHYPTAEMRGAAMDSESLQDIKPSEYSHLSNIMANQLIITGPDGKAPAKRDLDIFRSHFWQMALGPTGTKTLDRLSGKMRITGRKIHVVLDPHSTPRSHPHLSGGKIFLDYQHNRRRARAPRITFPTNLEAPKFLACDTEKKHAYSASPFHTHLAGMLYEACECVDVLYDQEGAWKLHSKTVGKMRKEDRLEKLGPATTIVHNPLETLPFREARPLSDKNEDAFFVLELPTGTPKAGASEELSLTPMEISRLQTPAKKVRAHSSHWVSPGTDEDTETQEYFAQTVFAEPDYKIELADMFSLTVPTKGAFADIFFFQCGHQTQLALKLLQDHRLEQEADREVFAAGLTRLIGDRIDTPKGKLLTSDSEEMDVLETKLDEAVTHIDGLSPADKSKYLTEKRDTLASVLTIVRQRRFQRHSYVAILWERCPGKTPNLYATAEKNRIMETASPDEQTYRKDNLDKVRHEYHEPLIKDANFMEALGQLYLNDLLIGNFDRFGGWFHASNLLYDQETKTVHGIDQSCGFMNTNRTQNFMLYKGKDPQVKHLKLTGYSAANVYDLTESLGRDRRKLEAFKESMESHLMRHVNTFIEDFISNPFKPARIIQRFYGLHNVRGIQGYDPLPLQLGFADALFELPRKEYVFRQLLRLQYRNFHEEAQFIFHLLLTVIQKIKSIPQDHYRTPLMALRERVAKTPFTSIEEHFQQHPLVSQIPIVRLELDPRISPEGGQT